MRYERPERDFRLRAGAAANPPKGHMPIAIWTAFVIIALLFLDVLRLTVYGVLVPAAALVLLVTVVPSRPRGAQAVQWRIDPRDMTAVAVCFLLVVALFRLAFTVFTVGRVTGLFLGFAAGLGSRDR